MSELQFIVVGATAGAAFVEIVIRLRTLRHLSALAAVIRKAASVVASNQISDHWKEVAVPAYAMIILRTVVVTTSHLAFAIAIYAAIIAIALALWSNTDIGVATFLNWMLNIGVVAGGIVFALIRQRIAR